MIFLRGFRTRQSPPIDQGYPFDLPLLQTLDEIEFKSPVSFLVGENGTGKSTILEAIAAAANSITIGSAPIALDESLEPARKLASILTLVWTKRTHLGFFLRAEDLANFGTNTSRLTRELREEADAIRAESASFGALLAAGALVGQSEALKKRYGADLNARSHGESFLQVFQHRFVPGGLYLLDEPDTALSPQRQLGLLALIAEMVSQESQFLIATHSPILMAFPGATILDLNDGAVRAVAYDDVPNVSLTRDFLNDPNRFLRHLLPTDGR